MTVKKLRDKIVSNAGIIFHIASISKTNYIDSIWTNSNEEMIKSSLCEIDLFLDQNTPGVIIEQEFKKLIYVEVNNNPEEKICEHYITENTFVSSPYIQLLLIRKLLIDSLELSEKTNPFGKKLCVETDNWIPLFKDKSIKLIEFTSRNKEEEVNVILNITQQLQEKIKWSESQLEATFFAFRISNDRYSEPYILKISNGCINEMICSSSQHHTSSLHKDLYEKITSDHTECKFYHALPLKQDRNATRYADYALIQFQYLSETYGSSKAFDLLKNPELYLCNTEILRDFQMMSHHCAYDSFTQNLYSLAAKKAVLRLLQTLQQDKDITIITKYVRIKGHDCLEEVRIDHKKNTDITPYIRPIEEYLNYNDCNDLIVQEFKRFSYVTTQGPFQATMHYIKKESYLSSPHVQLLYTRRLLLQSLDDFIHRKRLGETTDLRAKEPAGSMIKPIAETSSWFSLHGARPFGVRHFNEINGTHHFDVMLAEIQDKLNRPLESYFAFSISNGTFTEPYILKISKGLIQEVIGSTAHESTTLGHRDLYNFVKKNNQKCQLNFTLPLSHDGNCSRYSDYALIQFRCLSEEKGESEAFNALKTIAPYPCNTKILRDFSIASAYGEYNLIQKTRYPLSEKILSQLFSRPLILPQEESSVLNKVYILNEALAEIFYTLNEKNFQYDNLFDIRFEIKFNEKNQYIEEIILHSSNIEENKIYLNKIETYLKSEQIQAQLNALEMPQMMNGETTTEWYIEKTSYFSSPLMRLLHIRMLLICSLGAPQTLIVRKKLSVKGCDLGDLDKHKEIRLNCFLSYTDDPNTEEIRENLIKKLKEKVESSKTQSEAIYFAFYIRYDTISRPYILKISKGIIEEVLFGRDFTYGPRVFI